MDFRTVVYTKDRWKVIFWNSPNIYKIDIDLQPRSIIKCLLVMYTCSCFCGWHFNCYMFPGIKKVACVSILTLLFNLWSFTIILLVASKRIFLMWSQNSAILFVEWPKHKLRNCKQKCKLARVIFKIHFKSCTPN